MFIIMASPISTPTTSCCSNSIPTCSKPALSPSCSISYTTSPKNGVFTLNSLPGFGSSCQWSGLKYLGISITPKLINKRRTMRFNGKMVRASLFGVGAPEALVIGVVALLVFGPKGLAEVARNLGKTLREFQPTIRELQDVSREFKSTLEREIGLDEIPSQNTYAPKNTNTGSNSSSVGSSENASRVDDPNGAALPKIAYTTEEYLKLTEEQLKAAAVQQEDQTPSTSEEPPLETQSGAEVAAKQSADTMTQPQKPENEAS